MADFLPYQKKSSIVKLRKHSWSDDFGFLHIYGFLLHNMSYIAALQQ